MSISIEALKDWLTVQSVADPTQTYAFWCLILILGIALTASGIMDKNPKLKPKAAIISGLAVCLISGLYLSI